MSATSILPTLVREDVTSHVRLMQNTAYIVTQKEKRNKFLTIKKKKRNETEQALALYKKIINQANVQDSNHK